ncbi:hypothetical protein L910_3116 [Vibrio fluvialis PG41]|uniref:Uncharacterized protein n=1 Tax=Vibrio fluvialis PG41 TaxID=1336752 RepID=S7I8P0_VIBFL|nr:hypothetical protein L910_3116 [Vibrio fluvialis PG41]
MTLNEKTLTFIAIWVVSTQYIDNQNGERQHCARPRRTNHEDPFRL